MFRKLFVLLSLLTITLPVWAIGATILTAAGYASATWFAAAAIAINLVVSAVVTYAFQQAMQPDTPSGGETSADLGSRAQVPPATSNKLPVIYGTAWTGGIITDLSITSDNQQMYYVLSLCEVTGLDGISDDITFGDIYYGGKRVIFQANGHTVESLLDESTGVYDGSVNGKIDFYLYKDGSNNPANSSTSAITLMNSGGLTYTWDSSKLMTKTVFCIIRLQYSISANIRGINQTKFQITNARTKPGDVLLDYMRKNRYGCAIPPEQIDTASLLALNTYSDTLVNYDTYIGTPATIPRYRFDGQVAMDRSCMDNLQDMMNSCDCILKYNEINGKWGVIINSTDYTVAMNINDSNMISAITISPLDIANSYNYIEVKFPNNQNQDAFDSANYDLAELAPDLLYPNEPVTKLSVNLPYVNSSVRAQIIANRLLKASREDLQVSVSVMFVGLQFEAGDVVTLTSANYGWTDKLFRLLKVTETFNDDGSIQVNLTMSEFNPSVYSDVSVKEFNPAPNTGIGDPTFFGTINPPIVVAQYQTASIPSFVVQTYAASSGITQYVEIWYSAYSNPLQTQMYFAGTTEIQSNGNPWTAASALPTVTLANIPAGNWYLFTRAVNSLASSDYSSASSLLYWRPATYQFTEKYLAIAYADDINGGGFSLSPTNKSYYGLYNTSSESAPSDASFYTWYLAEPTFGTANFLLYCNRGSRKFSFDTGLANLAAGSGAFVPTVVALFDPSLWSAANIGFNVIDLDLRTGQLLETGTTTVGTGEIAVRNTPDGKVVASLQQYLNFGTGVYTYTGSAATLTVDIYGRIVGFTSPDNFYYSEESFTATEGQKVFNVTRGSGYIVGQCFVFVNGVLDRLTNDYTETASAITFNSNRNISAGATVTVISFKSVDTASTVYASFSKEEILLSNASSYTPSGFTLKSGFELLFLNGVQLTELDYDIIDGVITNFPTVVNGLLNIYQWTPNNLGQPNGTPVNVLNYTVPNQALYTFSYDPNAFNIYENGVLLTQGTDFTTATGTYTLIPTPTNINVVVQQTFARTGAV